MKQKNCRMNEIPDDILFIIRDHLQQSLITCLQLSRTNKRNYLMFHPKHLIEKQLTVEQVQLLHQNVKFFFNFYMYNYPCAVPSLFKTSSKSLLRSSSSSIFPYAKVFTEEYQYSIVCTIWLMRKYHDQKLQSWKSDSIKKETIATYLEQLNSNLMKGIEPDFNATKMNLLGLGGTGKSCLLSQLTVGIFLEEYDPCVEDVFRKALTFSNLSRSIDILDTAGSEEYHIALRKIPSKEPAVYAFPVNEKEDLIKVNKETLRTLEEMHRGKEEKIPLVLIATKTDLPSHVSDFDILKLWKELVRIFGHKDEEIYDVHVYETSSKLCHYIREPFLDLLHQIDYSCHGNSLHHEKNKRQCTCQ